MPPTALIPRREVLISAAALTAVAMGARAADPAPTPPPAFVTTTLALYLPEDVMRERGPPTELLVEYVKALIAAAQKAVATKKPGPGVTGAIVVALKPPGGRSKVWVMIGDGAREAEFTDLLKAPLEAVQPPPGVRDVNAFGLGFTIWGGGTPLAQASLPMPEEWRRAMPKGGGGTLPDDALRVVWPN